jgi:hypothetical protein
MPRTIFSSRDQRSPLAAGSVVASVSDFITGSSGSVLRIFDPS